MFRRVAICGVGLIGGSLGLAIKGRWPSAHVTGVDRRDVLDVALERGAIDRAEPDLAAAADADLIVLSAPVAANLVLLRQVQALDTRALVTDTGGTKRDIV